jgi:hypothetical protein
MATQGRGHAIRGVSCLCHKTCSMGGMPTALGGHAKRQEPDMATQGRGHATRERASPLPGAARTSNLFVRVNVASSP